MSIGVNTAAGIGWSFGEAATIRIDAATGIGLTHRRSIARNSQALTIWIDLTARFAPQADQDRAEKLEEVSWNGRRCGRLPRTGER
jgi:hypothetical protein